MSMDFEEFKKEISNRVKEYLPQKFEDSNIEFKEILKNNDTILNAVLIENPDTNITPTIYIDKMFEEYKNGEDINIIAGNIADIYIENTVDKSIDISIVTDFDKVKDNIVPRLVNAEENREILADKPHMIMEDLAVTYHIQLESNEMGTASVAITNMIMDLFGVSQDELHKVAVANLEEKMPATLRDMNEVVKDMIIRDCMNNGGMDVESATEMAESMMPAGDTKMFVLSCENAVNGATVVLNEKAMDMVKEQVGEEFFVLPSSLHELLIVPKEDGMTVSDLENMVREVNATQVAPEEKLSDHVYQYDANEKELFRADRAEEHEKKLIQKHEHKREQVQDKGKSHERVSVKDKLMEKKAKATEVNKGHEKNHEKEKAIMIY